MTGLDLIDGLVRASNDVPDPIEAAERVAAELAPETREGAFVPLVAAYMVMRSTLEGLADAGEPLAQAAMVSLDHIQAAS
jgi:hypothetical protein